MTARSAPRHPTIDPVLAADLNALRREMEARRLGIFREHIGRSVCLASPLLLDACRPEELDDAAWRLRPPPNWPVFQGIQMSVRGWSAASAAFGQRRAASATAEGRTGAAVADMLSLRICHRSAHMILRVGETVVQTGDDGGRLLLPGIMSTEREEWLLHGSLERAFTHPILTGRDYRIHTITPDAIRMRTVVEFVAAPAEWRLPWARPPWQRQEDPDEVPF